MDTLICAGGSGARVLEAVLHLCAAGLGPTKLRVFVIDPDSTNGNGEGTGDLINRYEMLQRTFGKGPFNFFGTELDLLRGTGDGQGLQVWSPVKRHQKFRSVLNFEALSAEQKDIVHLLFTPGELEMEMQIGYQGHPALGAAALSLLELLDGEVPLLAAFAEELRNDVASGVGTVMIAGSVFGGTGASTIHPLVRYLRGDSFLEKNKKNLKVGAVALVPYFQFSSSNDTKVAEEIKQEAARSEDFPLASKSAAEYYHHLQTTDDWDFDAMYWVGDDSPKQVQYSPGGKDQKNPAHFVDLLAGLAVLDFFSNRPDGKACWYCGPDVEDFRRRTNPLTRHDLPIRGSLFGNNQEQIVDRLELFQMMIVGHLGFFGPLLTNPRLAEAPYFVPWYLDRFSGANDGLASGGNADDLKRLSEYWRDYYLPWWAQVHDAEGRVQLLNTTAWKGKSVECNRLGNLLYPDAAQHDLSAVDQLFGEMVHVSGKAPDDPVPANRYVTLLGLASQQALSSRKKNQAAA